MCHLYKHPLALKFQCDMCDRILEWPHTKANKDVILAKCLDINLRVHSEDKSKGPLEARIIYFCLGLGILIFLEICHVYHMIKLYMNVIYLSENIKFTLAF